MEQLFNTYKPSEGATRLLGRQTVKILNPVYIAGTMSIAGEKEGDGPLKEYFDKVCADDRYGTKTFEAAEQAMLKDAIDGALISANFPRENLQAILSGDLLNQIISASYTARSFNSAFLGLYGACSSMGESLLLAACLIDAGFLKNAACATSSHFSSAERQYRGPLEYGAQKPPYSQWTVTGAGCAFLSSEQKGIAKITHATMGRVVDYGIVDISQMGGAMAPAACDTLKTFFIETGLKPSDFDLIATGDLGKLGSDILRKLMSDQGFELGSEYADCGAMIYNVEQKAFQGGSGCGCSAVVLNGFILKRMAKRELRRVLFAPTGALMSLTSNQQGESIPAVCHAVMLESI